MTPSSVDMAAAKGNNHGPIDGMIVDDWIQTLGMSLSLAQVLNIPLEMPMGQFLEQLPGQSEWSTRKRLKMFLRSKEKLALKYDTQNFKRLQAKFMHYGNGEGGDMIKKMLSLPIPDNINVLDLIWRSQ